MFPTLIDEVSMGRRQAIAALRGSGMALGMSANAAPAQTAPSGALDLTNPVDNLYAFGKIWSTYADKPPISAYHGLMYLRIGDRRMMPIFGYVGTGVLHAKFDAKTGTLIRKSRETGYFTDLRSGDILESWTNPVTGETLPVYHFYNDLAAFRMQAPDMPVYALGKPGESPTVMNEGTAFPGPGGKVPLPAPLAGSARAGRRAAVVMSLIQSARLNGHDPYAFLRDVLERLPLTPEHRLEELLPHVWRPADAGRMH